MTLFLTQTPKASNAYKDATGDALQPGNTVYAFCSKKGEAGLERAVVHNQSLSKCSAKTNIAITKETDQTACASRQSIFKKKSDAQTALLQQIKQQPPLPLIWSNGNTNCIPQKEVNKCAHINSKDNSENIYKCYLMEKGIDIDAMTDTQCMNTWLGILNEGNPPTQARIYILHSRHTHNEDGGLISNAS